MQKHADLSGSNLHLSHGALPLKSTCLPFKAFSSQLPSPGVFYEKNTSSDVRLWCVLRTIATRKKMEASILSVPGCCSRLTASVTTKKGLEFAQKKTARNAQDSYIKKIKYKFNLDLFGLKCYALVIYLLFVYLKSSCSTNPAAVKGGMWTVTNTYAIEVHTQIYAVSLNCKGFKIQRFRLLLFFYLYLQFLQCPMHTLF